MDIMPTETELVTTLRDAALQRDWRQCCYAAEKALSRLPVLKVLKLAHQEVQRRLPLFERHHPHIHWPRVWLDAIVTWKADTLDWESPELREETHGPGGDEFTGAVRMLAQAATAKNDLYVTCAMSAMDGAIQAERMEVGGSEHRELWDRWFLGTPEALSGDPRLYSALATVLNDPKVAAVELAGWTRLVDELAAALEEEIQKDTLDTGADVPTAEVLTRLRRGAQRGEWLECRPAAAAALSRLTVPQILQIAYQEVERRLPLFERHNPHIHWPRAWLSAIAAGSAGSLDHTSPELAEKTSGPGGSTFGGAVMDLAIAAASADSAERLEYAMGAIAGSIMAEKEEIGGTEHRELWDLLDQDPLGTRPRDAGWLGYVERAVVSGPKVAAAELAAWNRLADELSAALSAAGS